MEERGFFCGETRAFPARSAQQRRQQPDAAGEGRAQRKAKAVPQIGPQPAPDAGSHWTYMGGNYVLITDTEGKILKVYDGEIFYHR